MCISCSNVGVCVCVAGLYVEFVRTLSSGRSTDPLNTFIPVMYAILDRTLPASITCADELPYHGGNRGFAYIDFVDGIFNLPSC